MSCDDCNNSASNQKLLPCFHSFCLHCLEKLNHDRENDWSEGKKQICPKCDEEFQGLEELSDNVFAERFCRLGRRLCDVCSDDENFVEEHNVVPTATMYCPLCCQGLCERCAVEHRRQKLSKSHQLIEFSTPDILMRASKIDALAYCVEHSEISQRILCSTCNQLVCVLCFLDDHADKDHRWSKPDEEIAKLRKDLQQSVEQMSSLLGDVRHSKELVLGKESRRLHREELQIQEEIGRHYESLKEMIDEHKKQLLLELDARKSKTLEQMERRIDDKTRKLSNRLTGCINYFEQLTEFGTYDELHSALKKFEETSGLQNFKERYLKEIENNRLTESLTLTFQPLPLPTDNFIGSISTSGITSKRARIQLDDAGEKDAWGVTWLDNFIYILTNDSILKFSDQFPFDRIEEIDMFAAGRYLSDIASCPTNERLYIIDQVDFQRHESSHKDHIYESCIWKVEINSDPRNKVSKWVSRLAKSYIFTLSVSSSGQVIISDPSYKNSIEIYNKDAELVQSISLNIRYANHAIATKDNEFVVAYGKYEEEHGLLRVVDDQRDITDLDLNYPWYLAVYENDEILVADMKNDRVLLLHPTLELKRDLLTKEHDEVTEPRRLCYVKERRMLIVIHGEKGKTRVVDLFYDNYWG